MMPQNDRANALRFRREVPRDIRGAKPRLFRRVLDTSQGVARSVWGMDERVLTVRIREAASSAGSAQRKDTDPDTAHPIIIETSAKGQLFLITMTRDQASELAEALLDAIQRTPVDVTSQPVETLQGTHPTPSDEPDGLFTIDEPPAEEAP